MFCFCRCYYNTTPASTIEINPFLRVRGLSSTSSSCRRLPTRPCRTRSRPHQRRRPVIPLLSQIKLSEDACTALQRFYAAHHQQQDYPSCSALLYRLARARDFSAVDALLALVRSRRIRCGDALFNALIEHYGKANLPARAVELFLSIPSFNTSPNSPTLQSFNFLLNALVEADSLPLAEALLGRSKEMGLRPNQVSYNIIIKGRCSKCGWESAYEMFEEMLGRRVRPSAATYNTLIGFSSRNGGLERAMALKDDMVRRGVRPNVVTCALLMEGQCLQGKYDAARKMMFDMEYWGCKAGLVNYGVLMTDRAKNGRFDEARELLAEMKKRGYKPDVATYNIFVNYLFVHGRAEEAYKMFVEMQLRGCHPSAATFRMMVDGFCKVGDFERGLGVLNAMLVSKHCPRVETFHRMVAGLCGLGKDSDACFVLTEMEKRKIGLGCDGWRALVRAVCSDTGDDGATGGGLEALESIVSESTGEPARSP
ncbi:hypothetical protein Taro_018187 [Colocasia esculenta]|uniref:Pentatricopeptide repeat-containing protein n=1 Tax=Colocasia esculenta TaxID=4460 RepID=A0A843UT71_COLES|nr:hypothetical protein [Colocasia esculenta]